jgi:hypothetical protein
LKSLHKQSSFLTLNGSIRKLFVLSRQGKLLLGFRKEKPLLSLSKKGNKVIFHCHCMAQLESCPFSIALEKDFGTSLSQFSKKEFRVPS